LQSAVLNNQSMKIFDTHYHIDRGTEGYNIQPQKRNWIFNFTDQYKLHVSSVPKDDTRTLIFDYNHQLPFIRQEITSGQLAALKIHSRLLKITDTDYSDLFDAFSPFSHFGLPVIMDAFYFGDELEVQPNLRRIAEMAKLFPETTFIIAHSGGIKVLEYFLHLKNLPNVVFELSLSLSYLKHASVYKDFEVLLRFGDKNRIIFGTDFPYVDPADQLGQFLKISREIALTDEDQEKILYTNAVRIFGGEV
jgi:predicted TIM-barrel fold metal-dependent hydrolase